MKTERKLEKGKNIDSRRIRKFSEMFLKSNLCCLIGPVEKPGKFQANGLEKKKMKIKNEEEGRWGNIERRNTGVKHGRWKK